MSGRGAIQLALAYLLYGCSARTIPIELQRGPDDRSAIVIFQPTGSDPVSQFAVDLTIAPPMLPDIFTHSKAVEITALLYSTPISSLNVPAGPIHVTEGQPSHLAPAPRQAISRRLEGDDLGNWMTVNATQAAAGVALPGPPQFVCPSFQPLAELRLPATGELVFVLALRPGYLIGTKDSELFSVDDELQNFVPVTLTSTTHSTLSAVSFTRAEVWLADEEGRIGTSTLSDPLPDGRRELRVRWRAQLPVPASIVRLSAATHDRIFAIDTNRTLWVYLNQAWRPPLYSFSPAASSTVAGLGDLVALELDQMYAIYPTSTTMVHWANDQLDELMPGVSAGMSSITEATATHGYVVGTVDGSLYESQTSGPWKRLGSASSAIRHLHNLRADTVIYGATDGSIGAYLAGHPLCLGPQATPTVAVRISSSNHLHPIVVGANDHGAIPIRSFVVGF